MDTTTNVTIEETEVMNNEVETTETTETTETQETTATNNSFNNIIKRILGEGCKRVNGLKVKNVNWDNKDNYTRVSFTLASKVRAWVSEDNGNTWKLGTSNTIFTSLYAIAGALKEDESLGWLANTLLEKPEALNLIFNGATIDVIQQDVEANKPYHNPFSSGDKTTTSTNDYIINHVVKFKLGATGQNMANILAVKMMGF